jgi:aryl-alcohol dehydrogenase-like predicted oxidoreductase
LQKNQLGNSDLYVSEIGLGCMSLGTNLDKAITIIREAIDRGVNYLDTADLYDFGVNEEIVGQAIKGIRDDIIIATKVGNRFEAGKDGWDWDPSKAYIKEAVKRNLKRLDIDYIDLYQLHGGTIDDPMDETIEAFEELTKEGLIRYYGISSIRPNVIREYVKRSNIVSVMMQYSILDRRPEEKTLDLLEKNNISVIARGPLAKGLLSDSWREKLNAKQEYLNFSNPELQEIVSAVEKIKVSDWTLTSTALQYCLTHPAVAAVIPGASSIDQVRVNTQPGQPPLTEEEYKAIQEVVPASLFTKHR